MEKGPSTFGSQWAYPGSDEVHADKHGPEFGFDKKDVVLYRTAAQVFVNTKEYGNMLFRKKNGSIYKYKPSTKELAVYTKNGIMITYYRTSLRYFINEFNNKGGVEWLYKGDYDDEKQ